VPMWDLPREELPFYAGRNPRPADLDEYWAAALTELDETPPQVEIVPAEFTARGAECFDLTFTGLGGARVYAKYLRPGDQPDPAPGIAVFHGYSMSSPQWFDLLPYVAEGYSVLAMDCRGQGGRSQDAGGPMRQTLNGHLVRGLLEGPRHLLYRSVFTDTVRTLRVLMELPGVDPARIGVTGASQGGGLSLAAAALEPRVRAVAPIYPFLTDYQRVWELDLAEDAYLELQQWLRRFDPTHQREVEFFTTLGYIDVQHIASRIRATVLLVTALMDRICPPSTQFAAYNKIASDKSVVYYPDFGHEGLPGVNDLVLRFFAAELGAAP
jgi:cephalosporin-C deacetylase